MAVVVRKKSPAQHVPFVCVGDSPVAQDELLEAMGLVDPVKPKITIRRLISIVQGMRVKITNDLFPWVQMYKPGDTGVVVNTWTAPPSTYTKHPHDDLCEVALDVPRIEGKEKVILAVWEIEAILG